MKPEALIFDVDDTLADVTDSYRQATIATAAHFGVEISFEDITQAKAGGNANNDWVLTRKLLEQRGVIESLENVTRRFEDFYQGTDENPGMRLTEKLLLSREKIERLAGEYKLGIVTGRPRKDAHNFLIENKLEQFFDAVVTMDDAPLKPDPEPVRLALRTLKVSTAWMFGDTPDDIRSARAAGITAIGVVAPADDPAIARAALFDAGANEVLDNIADLDRLFK